MYRVNRETNNVEKLEKKLFGELKIRERQHLQEWIVKNPEILGEELLIIQKEFDGFNDTNERLDLLAIDKKGDIVIIENKLDDTGRNVAWQAIKYTSYCSTFTTDEIIDIYQSYLDKWHNGEDAKQNIIDFLEITEKELFLNRNDQRMIFVANHFRKEVTSTVLWLLKHNIQIICFRATPYSMGEEVFLQIEQIIPLPETKEYMIHAMEKQKEESEKSKVVEESEARLMRFWNLLKIKLKENKIDYLDKVGAGGYYNIGFTKGPGLFSFSIGRHGFRVELYISNDTNKVFFDSLFKKKGEIDRNFGEGIIWERLDKKKASRIKYEMIQDELNKLSGKFSDELYWEVLIDWYYNSMVRFYKTINPIWEKVQKEILK